MREHLCADCGEPLEFDVDGPEHRDLDLDDDHPPLWAPTCLKDFLS